MCFIFQFVILEALFGGLSPLRAPVATGLVECNVQRFSWTWLVHLVIRAGRALNIVIFKNYWKLLCRLCASYCNPIVKNQQLCGIVIDDRKR